jgi:hypothetical protein
MKKINFIAVLTLVAGSLIFSGCSKEQTKDLSPDINGSKDIEAILKNPTKRDMAKINNHLKDLQLQIGDSKLKASSTTKYNRVERWDKTASIIEIQTNFWYNGTKLTEMGTMNPAAGWYSGDTYFTYDGDKILWQDEYTLDNPDWDWRWLGYYEFHYNTNNTISYIIEFNTDGTVFKYATYTYKPGTTKIDKIYLYQWDSDHLIGIYNYKYNLRNQISSVSITDPANGSTKVIDTYTYNSNGTLASKTLVGGDRKCVYTYAADYWYMTEYWLGNVSNYYVYYRDMSGSGNYEPWDPKNMFNLNILDINEF